MAGFYLYCALPAMFLSELKFLRRKKTFWPIPEIRVKWSPVQTTMNEAVFQILQIGNDSQMPEVLSNLLHEDGIVVSFVHDADDAFTAIHERHIDLLLVDLETSNAEGFKLLRYLKDNPPSPPMLIITLTSPDDALGKLRAFDLGATDCVNKPLDPAVFHARLRGALQTKRRFDNLIQKQSELIEARLAAEADARSKSDFLAAMSHEIRTPMNGVIAMVGLLLETPMTAEQRGYLETIHTSSDALLTIINDILDFSKIEAGKMELNSRTFDLRACIEETLDLMSASAFKKNLELIYEMEDSIPVAVEGDSLRLRQVLVNLLSNAVKFTKSGDVFVQVKLLSAKTDGTSSLHLHFSVRDTGIGIAPDKLARLFKPFMQAETSTAQRFGGTGLGLAISKRLVELMGGKMWAESVPGEGSTFHFTANVLTQQPVAPSALQSPQPKLENLRVLIVDDNATCRRVLGEQLTKWRMIPKSAENSQQALEWLRRGEQFDLAILDWQMPDMNGPALAQEIRKLPNTAAMPLLLLTPLGVHTDRKAVADAEFAQSIAKPVKPVQLCEILTRVVQAPKVTEKKTTAAPVPLSSLKNPGELLAQRLPLRILLAEDNELNQKVASRILQQMGYQPDIANNGREALETLERQPYDLVFMDLMMPEMDGLEATSTIRARQKDPVAYPNYNGRIIIIAMTAHAMQGDREKCIASGMDDYLAKPIRPTDVRSMIERWASPKNATETVKAAPVPETSKPVVEEPAVDMSRMADLTGGDEQSMRELIEMFFKQTTQQLAQIDTAIREKNSEQLKHVAHSCKGASATLGMGPFAKLLLELEQQGKTNALTNSPQVYENAMKEYKRIQIFLAAQQSKNPAPTATS
jgi:CheY-like chemotaxis protein/HPt (histidine-containing phosphotransfer) domain-containing protein